MEVTTEENSNNPKEERGKLILKEIENNFKQMTKNSPSELKDEIQTSLDYFSTITKGPEDQCLDKLDVLNTIVNKTSDRIKKSKNVNEETIKYMQEIKKSMYKLNTIENKPSKIRKEYHNGKYEGDYLNGKREGKGIYIYNSGDVYEGEYKNDLKDGFGIYKYSNGDIYEGNYKEGYYDGKGKYKYADGDVYDGEFKDNCIYGKGTFKKKNGEIYIGEFNLGLINGFGKYVNTLGEQYVGEFLSGKKNGVGKLYDKGGKLIQSGIWKNDKFFSSAKYPK